MIIYDIEIANPIAPANPADKKEGLFYAKSFSDYENMGIACIGVYDYVRDSYRVFGEYELKEFEKLVKGHDIICGFNNINFDNKLLRACDVEIPDSKSYDILAQIYAALGSRQKGCKLEDCIKANFPSSAGKSGNGADAPILWQRGYQMRVVDYCLNDVKLTKMLLDRIIRCGWLTNPIFPEQKLRIKRP